MLKLLIHGTGRVVLPLAFGVPRLRRFADEQCIVVANHNTHIDILILFQLFSLRRLSRVRSVAAYDYFSAGISGFLLRWLFNLILVDRRGVKAKQALQPVREALQQGYSLILFPEGTRGDPGVLQHFKTGVGQLAVEFSDIPVYPVLMSGVEKTLPRGFAIPVPFNVRVTVLDPLYGRDFQDADLSQARKRFTAALETLYRPPAQ